MGRWVREKILGKNRWSSSCGCSVIVRGQHYRAEGLRRWSWETFRYVSLLRCRTPLSCGCRVCRGFLICSESRYLISWSAPCRKQWKLSRDRLSHPHCTFPTERDAGRGLEVIKNTHFSSFTPLLQRTWLIPYKGGIPTETHPVAKRQLGLGEAGQL